MVFSMCILLGLVAVGWEQQADEASAGCRMIQEALSGSQKIKPDMARREVEQMFAPDGGLQFPNKWRYVYRKCEYIKIEVEYRAAANRGKQVVSPDDSVIGVSKPYLEYPVRD